MLRAWHRKLELMRWATEYADLPDARVPDDWPTTAGISANGLRPLQHGQHAPGHSAVYAAVNAIRLATAVRHGWTKRGEQELLEIAWAWRELHGQGSSRRGMRRGDFVRMVEALSFASARLHDQFITTRRPWVSFPPSQLDFFAVIERSIVAQDVVLILFAGAHYSVVRGFTPTSLLLFDSSGRHWLKRTSITLTDNHRSARYALAITATLILRRGC